MTNTTGGLLIYPSFTQVSGMVKTVRFVFVRDLLNSLINTVVLPDSTVKAKSFPLLVSLTVYLQIAQGYTKLRFVDVMLDVRKTLGHQLGQDLLPS